MFLCYLVIIRCYRIRKNLDKLEVKSDFPLHALLSKMVLLVTRSLGTGIHVAHTLFIRKKTWFLYRHKCQFLWCIYYISLAFGWRDGGRLWKISELLITGFRIMFGVSQVYEQAGRLGRLQETNSLHLYVHI